MSNVHPKYSNQVIDFIFSVFSDVLENKTNFLPWLLTHYAPNILTLILPTCPEQKCMNSVRRIGS